MLANYLKRGAYNTLFYGISSTIIRIVNFIFLPYFLSKLTTIEFGLLDFYQTIFSLATLFVSSGAAISLTRFYLLYPKNSLKQEQAISNGLLCGLLAISLFIPSFIIFAVCTKTFSLYLFLTISNVVLFTFFSLILALIRVREYLWYYILLFCGQSIVTTLLTALGVHFNYGVTAFFIANFVSLVCVFPIFFRLLQHYHNFSYSMLKEQIRFSFPLLISGFLYTSFFTIDRFFIKAYYDYELLGTYAILWRFGAIFQFLSIALLDAWPLVLYNAQNEPNSDVLISKLIKWTSIILATLYLGSMALSHLIIQLWLPVKYSHLSLYIPLFLLSLFILELGRVFQAGLGLSMKTIYSPLISTIALGIQSIFLLTFLRGTLLSILFINNASFIVYTFLCYYISKKIYPTIAVPILTIFYLLTSLSILIFTFQCFIWTNVSIFLSISILLAWLPAIWLLMINNEEKKIFIEKTGIIIIFLQKKLLKPVLGQ
jgi:O-antigen/teichoic acid export membrane protein